MNKETVTAMTGVLSLVFGGGGSFLDTIHFYHNFHPFLIPKHLIRLSVVRFSCQDTRSNKLIQVFYHAGTGTGERKVSFGMI